MKLLHVLVDVGFGTARQIGRGVTRGWRALRHPAGWYDEIDAVYGTHHAVNGKKSAGVAGLGGHISGGGG